MEVWEGPDNMFPFLAATSKNKNFLCKPNIKLPAYVAFEELWYHRVSTYRGPSHFRLI
jgi:hypothetical protein